MPSFLAVLMLTSRCKSAKKCFRTARFSPARLETSSCETKAFLTSFLLLSPSRSSMHSCFVALPSSPLALRTTRGNAITNFCRTTTYSTFAQTKRARCAGLKMSAAGSNDITQLLQSEDFLERIRGINRIDELQSISEKISSLLPVATGDSNQQVRYAAISRLSNLGVSGMSKQDADTVLDAARYVLLNDKEPSCQSGAADLIAGLKLTDGFDDLVNAFNQTSDWMLKFSIAAGMGEMGDPKAFDFLTSVLEETNGAADMLLITAAIGALGELGDQRGLAVIEKFLNSDDESIRERASIAHGVLSGGKEEP